MNCTEFFIEVAGAFCCGDEPSSRAHRENLDEGKALALELGFKGAIDEAACPVNAFGIVDRGAGAVRGALEPREEVADQNGVAMLSGIPSVDGILGALAQDSGCGHMAAGLSEDAIIQQDAGYVFTAGRCVYHLL